MIFHWIQTSFAKQPHIFVIFQGWWSGPLSGFTHIIPATWEHYGKMNNFTVAEIKFQPKIPISSDKIWSGNTDNANYDKRQGYWSGSN